MCGIAGLFRTDGNIDEATLQSMTEAVRHRGPDDSGIQLFDCGGIGNRRLSIIDCENGKQPLCNEDGTIWVTFNGEIYNFQALAAELKSNGHHFKTKSDTEVIAHAYEQWGTSAFTRFKGMFALAIVDLRNRKIVCARDHFGIKPFFYTATDKLFAFASELQQLQQIQDLDFPVDPGAIDNYLWLKYIPAPRTIFKNIFKLPPAHFLIYSLNGRIEKVEEYWKIHFHHKQRKTEAEWLEELDHTLRNSVRAHLISDVDVGILLSGGIDSTLLTSYAAECSRRQVKTFSIGFQEKEFDETPYARIASERFHTDHYSEILTSESINALPELVKHYGEPYGDSSCIAAYSVCKLAKQHVKVVLSGEGGDECFAGYLKYGRWLREKGNTPSDWLTRIRRFAERRLAIDFESSSAARSWLEMRESVNTDWRKKIWIKDYAGACSDTIQQFQALADAMKPMSPINRLQYVDLKTYLTNQLLVKMDIAGMIHGLEVRTPLTDKDVWEFAARIPENLFYIQKGRNFSGKLPLKKLALRQFDDSFVYRRKHGFVVPVNVWLSHDGPYRDYLQDSLFSPSARILDYFNRDIVLELIKSGSDRQIWQLLVLEEWLREFSQGKVSTGNPKEYPQNVARK